ncbi:MAG: hypothetical protein U1E60_19010 [Reyranellaceae bacterium]
MRSVVDAIEKLLSPLKNKGRVPSNIYTDAYVIGFLQIAIIYASGATPAPHGAEPPATMTLFIAVMDRLAGGQGALIASQLASLNRGASLATGNYRSGKQAAESGPEGVQALHDYIERNYMYAPER